jgi:hypothetical protein
MMLTIKNMLVWCDIIIFCRDFADLHTDSIDEPYYRSAVLHYGTDPESFVFSVPFDAGNHLLTITTFHCIIHTPFYLHHYF